MADLEALLQHALVHHQARRWPEAEAGYRAVLAEDPEEPNAWNLLGVVTLEQHQAEAAVPLIEKAIALYPEGAAFHVNLGNALRRSARWPEADAAYRRALALDPKLVDASVNLASLLNDQGRFAEAVDLLEAALPFAQDNATLALHMATALRSVGLLREGQAFVEHALRLKPDEQQAWNALGITLMMRGDHGEARAAFRKALALNPDFTSAHSNLMGALHYDESIPPEELHAEHLAWNRQHAAHLDKGPGAWDRDRDPERRLRVGYYSPDFREHSVAYFLEPLLAHHDPAQVEVFAYAHLPSPDAVSVRLQGLVHHWRDVTALSHEATAAKMREDAIDILVDLAGHMGSGRLQVFARRPAPIQVSWLGYPGSTGLAAMDARLSDAITEPEGHEAFSTERILRLPRGFHCYRPPEDAPAVAPLPALGAGHVTFGSFNNISKVGPGVLALWAALLRRVPGSRLILKDRNLADQDVAARLAAVLAEHGVPASRVDLLPRIPGKGGHLGAYGRLDLALDPFPYNGTTTTCEALWMGVPVLTLPGARHAARVGASLLTRVGLEDWIASSPEDFLARGAAFAADLDKLAALRASLRDRVAASPLGDAPGFAREVEAAYRGLWRQWCGQRTC
ncbi:MAG: tetratricopeptide repeat protein [Holophagaceae bacterium]|nr:tetratricopeptide repeat protein [Holophagaceae bacterium]